MDVMDLRRRLLQLLEGNNLKKRTFHVDKQNASELYLLHNIGCIPKFIVVLDDNVQENIDDYNSGEIFYFLASPTENISFQTKVNGLARAKNIASGRESSTTYNQVLTTTSVAEYSVDSVSLRIKKVTGNSDWSVAPSYTVDMYY